MLKIGNTEINKVYIGGDEVKKAYLGSNIVFDSSVDNSFTMTFNIANSPEVLTLPTPTNYLVDWGDGTTSDDNNQHLYTSAGVYTVKMFGVIDDFRYGNGGDKNKLLTVEQAGQFLGFNGQQFRGCVNLTYANISGVSFPGSSFRQIFDGCFSLSFIDLTGVGNIGTQMRLSFNDTFLLTNIVGLEDLDTSVCGTFDQAFRDSAINQDVSDWDYSNSISVSSFMSGKTAANYDYQFLDALYNKWAFGDPITGEGKLDFTKLTNFTTNLGTIQYSSAGAAARAFLVSEGLIITDGGNNGL